MLIRDIVPAALPSATVVFSGGPLVESTMTAGFTHLAEHMAFGQGLSRTQRLTAAEDAGIELNGFTAKNYVAFTADARDTQLHRPSLTDCLEQLRDLLPRAQRPLPLLLNEYDDIQHEAIMVLATPYEHAKELVLYHVFRDSPLANPILAEIGLYGRMKNGAYKEFTDKLLDPAKAVYILSGNDVDISKAMDTLSGNNVHGSISQVTDFWQQPVSRLNINLFDNRIHSYISPYTRIPETVLAFPVQPGRETDAALAFVPLLNKALAPFASASLMVFHGASVLVCMGPGQSRLVGKKIMQGLDSLAAHLRTRELSSAFHSARQSLMLHGSDRKMGLLTSVGAGHELLLMNSAVSRPELDDLDRSLRPICRQLLNLWREAYLGVCVLPKDTYKDLQPQSPDVNDSCSK
ncbi:Zn-dependent peptidase [Giardia duodenalis]|uniref:Zn-dependent peptidase n=1 Tax=Giardia intestinalis TaxID=5741 RepID=V6TBG9_GIAIN|nr:Zn-dependent peptidase [Giardia intestinalis]